jgi:CDP-glycerol glycerophosphotransferase (TagB/SpsB family)
VAHQAKELRRFGRLIAQQCADTVLPLREEMRQHNALTSAVSLLLGQVRKRGLRRACRGMTQAQHCPSGATNAASACNWAMKSAP